MKNNIKVLYLVTILLCCFLNVNYVLADNYSTDIKCIKKGDTPFKEDRPYSTDEYEKLKKSCCFGLTLYIPKTIVFGQNAYCAPFYYPAADFSKKIFNKFLNFYSLFYFTIILITFLLTHWLIKRKKLKK